MEEKGKERVQVYEITAVVVLEIEKDLEDTATLKENPESLVGEFLVVKSGPFENALTGHVVDVLEVNETWAEAIPTCEDCGCSITEGEEQEAKGEVVEIAPGRYMLEWKTPLDPFTHTMHLPKYTREQAEAKLRGVLHKVRQALGSEEN